MAILPLTGVKVTHPAPSALLNSSRNSSAVSKTIQLFSEVLNHFSKGGVEIPFKL
jgi:hypothetical protein